MSCDFANCTSLDFSFNCVVDAYFSSSLEFKSVFHANSGCHLIAWCFFFENCFDEYGLEWLLSIGTLEVQI